MYSFLYKYSGCEMYLADTATPDTTRGEKIMRNAAYYNGCNRCVH